ncbi:CBS domain-containing protein [Streptomyces caniscabiei]|nr:CBS domain-containing protein [Streptomyces caniscabiei]MDX3512610.1 hypothetical protein [Streptomyces caniscabiei]MDX3722135.1 hypothetical protein [Streptomyces caniscabiei]MDX3730670.1 hypothetical protein [Streptomyces caniscabiei]WEO30317.1 hypothetical protein IHE65_40090 [Streptomyces caniscabiei]
MRGSFAASFPAVPPPSPMTHRAVTAHADDTLVEAARIMARHQVERLPG